MSRIVRVAESAYMAINALRRGLYRRGFLQPVRLPRPVVSIGNISAGGAGKTPAVIALANALTERGIRVAILTRGYGRRKGSPDGLVTSADSSRFGDEPVLIKKRTNHVDVIVGANRAVNAIEYLRGNDCDLFLLDDGFQHLQVARDLDIVIEAPRSRFHRERRSALRDAALVIPRRLTLRLPPSVLGKKVYAFAGIADPEQFFSSLRENMVDVCGSMPFPDHHVYSAADLDHIRDAAAGCGAEAIVTTEKDAVKLGEQEMVAIPADFVFDAGVIDRVASLVRR